MEGKAPTLLSAAHLEDDGCFAHLKGGYCAHLPDDFSAHQVISILTLRMMVALLTLKVATVLIFQVISLLTSKLSSALTIQQSVHVARSRKSVEKRASPNAVTCRAAPMG